MKELTHATGSTLPPGRRLLVVEANRCKGPHTGLSDALPSVAPNHLANAYDDQNPAIERPVLISLHEAATHCAPGEV